MELSYDSCRKELVSPSLFPTPSRKQVPGFSHGPMLFVAVGLDSLPPRGKAGPDSKIAASRPDEREKVKQNTDQMAFSINEQDSTIELVPVSGRHPK